MPQNTYDFIESKIDEMLDTVFASGSQTISHKNDRRRLVFSGSKGGHIVVVREEHMFNEDDDANYAYYERNTKRNENGCWDCREDTGVAFEEYFCTVPGCTDHHSTLDHECEVCKKRDHGTSDCPNKCPPCEANNKERYKKTCVEHVRCSRCDEMGHTKKKCYTFLGPPKRQSISS